MIAHQSARLRHKVLDYYFLDMSVTLMRSRDRLERLDAVVAAFTNTNKNAGGKWDFQLPRKPQGG